MLNRIFIFFISIAIFSSCSNDFDLTEGGTESPVIYGLLSPNDTAIYIRVEKTFIDENIEPAILAQDPANLYYDDIQVTLQNLRQPNQVFTLKKVDGNMEGYPRDNGFFTNAPNYMYKLHINELPNGKLGDTTPYELAIKYPDGKILAKASTRVLRSLGEKDITSPSSSASLSFEYGRDFNFVFRSDPYAHIHDIALVIYYTEELNGEVEEKSIRWPIAKNYVSNQPNNPFIQYSVKGRAFYDFLRANVNIDNRVNRFLKNGSLEISSGGVELKNYITIVQANLGITSSGEVPTYTNVENGIGLFSSRTSVTRENITFTNMTRDSISKGIITKELNFR